MEVYITKKYLFILFLLEFGTLMSKAYNLDLWITATLATFFAIYLGHEWAHVIMAKAKGLEVKRVCLEIGGNCHILFKAADENDPQKYEKEASVYLMGEIWNFFCLSVAVVFMVVSSINNHNPLSFTFAILLILIFIQGLSMPGSDYQEYHRRMEPAEP
jgi:membrane protein insertase Oxa1/YidC/SpoIIIJ